MTGCVRGSRYEVAIGGTTCRTVSSGIAEAMFRRWSQSPDVILHGDLRTGFSWRWQNRTRITIRPVPDADGASRRGPLLAQPERGGAR